MSGWVEETKAKVEEYGTCSGSEEFWRRRSTRESHGRIRKSSEVKTAKGIEGARLLRVTHVTQSTFRRHIRLPRPDAHGRGCSVVPVCDAAKRCSSSLVVTAGQGRPIPEVVAVLPVSNQNRWP
jgi:hypothetical protein